MHLPERRSPRGHRIPRTGGRRSRTRPPTPTAVAAAAILLTVLTTAAASDWPTDGVPVVGLHYQDLAPGAAGDVVIAVASPGTPPPDAVDAASSHPCLAVGTPYNTAFEVWRIPAVVTEEPCRATVLVSAAGEDGEWRGAVLVAVGRVVGAGPLDPTAGVRVHYSSTTDRIVGDPAPGLVQREDITFENASGAPITLVSLSADAALVDLLGSLHERRADGQVTPVARPYLPADTELGVIQPGATRTFGLTVDEPGRLAPGRTAVTLGLLPIIRVGGAAYYLEGAVATLFSSEPAP